MSEFIKPTPSNSKMVMSEPTGRLRILRDRNASTDPGKLQMQWKRGEITSSGTPVWTEYYWTDLPVAYTDEE